MCWSLYIWTKILISYIDLEKEDVKSAEKVILITLTGPLAWHQPCHTCAWQRTHISYNYVRKSSRKVELFPNGTCINSGLASEANDNEEVHTF